MAESWQTMMQQFSEIVDVLAQSSTLAQFCLQCPMHGIMLDDKTIEMFTLAFVEDVAANSLDDEKCETDCGFLTFNTAQRYCMFIRESDMLDAAVTTNVVQHILNCFYAKYINEQQLIAMERECASSRDAVFALFFKSIDIRKPGFLKSLKTADGRNLLYLIAQYSGISTYLNLMMQFVDGKLLPKDYCKLSFDDEYCAESYNVFKQTFGHIVRSLVSCGVDPYQTADDGVSFVDLVAEQNFYALMHENYDDYIEENKEKAEEQVV